MRKRFRTLWADQRGDVNSLSMVLITVVLALGGIVGLTTLRDQVVQEFGDLSAAIGSLDHSYSFAAVSIDGCTSAGSSFDDESDFCDSGDPIGGSAECIGFTDADAE